MIDDQEGDASALVSASAPSFDDSASEPSVDSLVGALSIAAVIAIRTSESLKGFSRTRVARG